MIPQLAKMQLGLISNAQNSKESLTSISKVGTSLTHINPIKHPLITQARPPRIRIKATNPPLHTPAPPSNIPFVQSKKEMNSISLASAGKYQSSKNNNIDNARILARSQNHNESSRTGFDFHVFGNPEMERSIENRSKKSDMHSFSPFVEKTNDESSIHSFNPFVDKNPFDSSKLYAHSNKSFVDGSSQMPMLYDANPGLINDDSNFGFFHHFGDFNNLSLASKPKHISEPAREFNDESMPPTLTLPPGVMETPKFNSQQPKISKTGLTIRRQLFSTPNNK
ncbi:hypothetical protein MXB_5104 [Myxobolus squamalis]|nr:hypothetical protein MXB_5104 [Myxobolus squamalis]